MATRILAVLNQKGGVGKTTTCVNLGAALARRGLRVLLVDMDPQANLTVHLGLEPSQLQRTTYSLLIGQHGLAAAVQQTGVPGLFVVPSTLALANAEIQLASTVGRELVLREALEEWLHPTPEGVDALAAAIGGAADTAPGSGPDSGAATAASRPSADFVLIDCPPSLGTLTMNALCAAGEVLLPIQTEFFALQGVAGILESVRAVQRLNKGLRLSLVVPSLVDRRTTLARDVLDEVRSYFGDIVTKTEIRKNIKLAEAPSHGKTIFEWEPRCNGALDYESLAAEVLGESAPELDELPAIVDEAPDEPESDVEATERCSRETGDASSESAPGDTSSDVVVSSAPEASRRPPVARSSGIGLAASYVVDAAAAETVQPQGAPRQAQTTAANGDRPALTPSPSVQPTPERLVAAQSEPTGTAERLPCADRESRSAPEPTPPEPAVGAAAPEASTSRMPVATGAPQTGATDTGTTGTGTTGTGTTGTGTTGGARPQPPQAERHQVAAQPTASPTPLASPTVARADIASAARESSPAHASPATTESRASWWQSLRRSALRRDTPGS